MGQTLLWIELLAASCLMVAVVMVDGSRLKRPWLRLLFIATGVSIPLVCWLLVTYIAIWLRVSKIIGPPGRPLFLGVLAGIFIVVGAVIMWRGLPDRRAAKWHAWKLGLVFAAACVLSLMTFWNLDLNAKNELGRLRARADSIVAATFPPRIPEAQNAAIVYEQAFESLGMTTDSKIVEWAIPVYNWLNAPPGNQSTASPSDADIRKILKANSQGLNQLRRAAAMKQCGFVNNWNLTDLAGALLPQVSSLRTSSELLAADARMRAIDGDLGGAIVDLNALFAMSEHVTREPTVITALAAINIETRCVETMQIVLAGRNPTADELSSLKIDPVFSHGRTVRSALRGEEAMGLSFLAALSDSQYYPIPRRYLPEIVIPLYRVFLMDDEIRSCNLAVRECQRLAAMPYHRSRDQWKTFPRRLLKDRTGFLLVKKLPAIGSYPGKAAEGDAAHRLARVAIAMLICQVKTGARPETIDKLSPEFIEMIPRDPFDGKPLRMVRDPDGRTVFYSIGPDMRDDGGRTMDPDTKIGDITFRIVPGK